MNKVLFFTFFYYTFFIVHCAFSQNPLVKMWDKRFGGTQGELLACFQQTNDKGFILGGSSFSSVSGDKTQPTWTSWDYWVVKIDSLGNKQWDKDFGGTSDDRLYSIKQTSDGGYILGGASFSPISGDKSQATRGSYDFWVLKIDSLGNKIWDKDFGGSDVEYLSSIGLCADGGYILAGLSISGISGDKTQACWGASDYWIIKIDSLGTKQWDKDFGGNDDDEALSILQTTDGGYLLGGFSMSGISGNKTQSNRGGYDFWIVKTDSLGILQWDKTYGGTDGDVLYSMAQTNDEGFVLGGWSSSGISGDKTQPTWGTQDFWMVKVDSLGGMQWDKDFGSLLGEDEFGSIARTNEGGYIMAGTSYSGVGGDKTENNLGLEQTWVLKTDSLGNKIWDKTIFTDGHDESGFVVQTTDGCYAVANYENGGIAGYKTQANWDASGVSADYWIVKFCETLQANFVTTTNLCPGTCTDFMNTSTNAISYQWNFQGAIPDTSTAANPSGICYNAPGTYDVTLIATNATGSDTLLIPNYITVNPSPPPQSIAQNGDTLFAIAGSAFYQWYFNGSIISGATGYFYVAPASGDYNVVATDVNGCEVEAAVFNVLAYAQSLVIGQWSLYPNPVSHKLTIQKAQGTRETAVEISVYNLLGEMVLAVHLPTAYCLLPTCSIDVSNLPPGLYYIGITSSSHSGQFRTKFMKQ